MSSSYEEKEKNHESWLLYLLPVPAYDARALRPPVA
jgi:hypothetical protein